VLAVALLGLFETAEAVEFDRIFQHVRGRLVKAAAGAARPPERLDFPRFRRSRHGGERGLCPMRAW
jgi:hypothetical protein